MDVASRASRASYRPKVQRVKSAELKPKQEFQLKVKHFLPPNSYAPELYLLEVENRDDENETTGSTRPTTRSPQFTESEDERQSNRYRQKPRNATSPYRYTSPLPKIKSDRGGSQKTVESVTHFDQNGDTDGEKLVTVSNSWGGDTRRSPRRSPQTSRRSPPPRSPPPQNDYSHKQNEYPSQQNDYPPPQNDYPDTSRLNASPTHSGVTDKPVASSHQPVASKYDPRSATYTNQTNDSGIAGLTPEEYRENYDDAERRKNEYNESRQKELENRLNGDRMNGDLDDSDRQRRLREDQEREEWERKNRDEDERRRREEEDRRRREEEERQREEDERRRREEEREKMAREKLSGSDEGARSTHLTPMDPDWTKRGLHGDNDHGIVNQDDQKLDGPQGQRDDQARSYRQSDRDKRTYEQRDDQTRAQGQTHDQAGTYRQTDKDTRAYQTNDQTRAYERTDDKSRQPNDQSRAYGHTNDQTRDYGRNNDQTRDYGRNNDQTRDYGQTNDQLRAYGHTGTNDQTRDYGPNNDQTRDYGQTDDQAWAYSNSDKTLNEYDQRQPKGSVAVPSDNFVQVALRPDPNLNEPVSDSELYSKEDSSNSPRNTNATARNFPQNNDATYRQGNQRKIHEGSENPVSHRQNEREYNNQRYEPRQNNERNNDGHDETNSYTTGKVSKTFVKDGVEYRHSDDTNRQYQPPGTGRSVQQTRSSTRSYPRQETEDSVIPSSPSSESDQKQYLLRKQQKTQDRTYSRVADTKNQKGKNIHKSSFPVQNQGGRPVIHRRKSNQRKLSDLNRFPSPPPMNVASTDQDLDSGSQNLTKEQKQAEKKRLLQELEAAREARRAVERQREELVKKAKLMQNKTQNRRNHARDLWKKRYFEEKKRTPPLEEQCNKLRHELDVIHRKLMNALEGSSKDKNTRMENLKPSKQNNYKIQATRLTHEIDDLRRRLENAKMKLTAEMKLRNQAETELRALRAELTQKKIHLTLSRNQQMAMTPGGDSRYYRTPALSNKA
ncbi:Hypothetical predicted protein [Mytilus galloprovincialis]|uniref:Spermatogenesis-associated protein 1 C-terminal domain-containing protein n=1 Tax=Mytilus galloprovincialis TaxID=29158 RepID=A0A8B6E9K8_MYTGA|nr:Hypothetical predicted protein [Mytilus galloprovincialis]